MEEMVNMVAEEVMAAEVDTEPEDTLDPDVDMVSTTDTAEMASRIVNVSAVLRLKTEKEMATEEVCLLPEVAVDMEVCLPTVEDTAVTVMTGECGKMVSSFKEALSKHGLTPVLRSKEFKST
jgi:hypothetical protein